MAFWNRKKEQRASLESPDTPLTPQSLAEWVQVHGLSSSGISVTVENALTVPAIWAAVNFISATIAGLPLHVYRKTEAGRERVTDPVEAILHDAPNDEMSSFEWRKYTMERVLTGGRGLSVIERNLAGRVINIWPINPLSASVKRVSGRKRVVVRESNRVVTYEGGEVIDTPFMLQADMVGAISPISKHADTIALAIAATQYGSKIFQNGGVPPFVMTGAFQTGAALKRASSDLEETVREAAKENRLALSLPAGHEIKSIGIDPDKSQLVQLKRFIVEEVARIYSLPPNFLQDLTSGTFNNTEQQDLHLVKHTIRRWVVQLEQELNLKLFGRFAREMYCEFNLDGLLRGDFKSRMDGYAQAIQNAILKPSQVHSMENMPTSAEADVYLIQGATVPLGSQPVPAGGATDEA